MISTDKSAQAFGDRYVELSSQFAARTRNDADTLEHLSQKLSPSEDIAEQLAEIRRIAHRLAGGAALFGHPGLTEPAAAVEAAIDGNQQISVVEDATLELVRAIRTTVGTSNT